jgi:hypothetical protein
LFPADTKGGLDNANIDKKAESSKLSAINLHLETKKEGKPEGQYITGTSE